MEGNCLTQRARPNELNSELSTVVLYELPSTTSTSEIPPVADAGATDVSD